MAGLVNRLLRRRKRPTPVANAQPGDGIGYPVAYTGDRMKVDHEFLKRCKALAPYSGAYRLNETTVVKSGEAVRMAEAATMRLIKESTTIPIPRVLDAYLQENDGLGVIIMEYVAGETWDKAWEGCEPGQRQQLVSELRGYLRELEGITTAEGTSSESRIGAVDGSPCCDQFFSAGVDHGPYQTVAQFHDALARTLLERFDNSWSRMVGAFITSLNGCQARFTHNDLAPRNILVKDGKIVAILDWELSGFFPDYWEYVKAHLWADWDSAWIVDRIPDQILEPKMKELAYLLHARDITR